MSEATADSDDDTTLLPTGGPQRPRRRFGPFRGRTVIAVVVILLLGVLATWAVSGSHRSTSGAAVPGAAANTSGVATTGPTSPAVPAGLTAVLDSGAVRLTWQPVTGARYAVFRDGKHVTTVIGATTWRDTTAAAGHNHGYQVQAVTSAGGTSALSPTVSIAVPGSTKAAPPSGKAAPPANTPPMPASWPSAATTGAKGALTTVNGDVKLAKAGQVYQNMHVKGTITVTACNVTIRNVQVDSGEPFTGDSTPDLFAIWLQQSATCGTTIDHVTTLTESAPNVYVTTSIRDARGGPVTITNSKLLGAQLGILGMSHGTIRGNYIELGKRLRGDHNDAIQGDGSSDLTIDHNTLLNPNDQTSALALYTEYGNNTNVTVSDNLMAGGGYTCYCGDGATDNDGNAARAVNVSVINNVFWRKYYSDAGYFGSGRAYNPAGGGRWAGNVYMNADGTLTTQQVEQPTLDGQ
jgi:hypothetical protein